MEITHSYEGLGLDYLQAREGIPRFAEFITSKIRLETTNTKLPVTIIELGVGSGQQTKFVEKELISNGLIQCRILAYDKSYQSKTGEKPGQLNILKERIAKGEISERVVPIYYDFDGHILPIASEKPSK